MPSLSKQISIPYAPEQIFDLVSDVARYPEFIKWIRDMKVSGLREEQGIRYFRGEASVGFKGFSERFSTDVAADPEKHTIDVSLVRGPFRRLKNRWALGKASDGTTLVDFFIDYEFRNPVLSLLARANTDLAVSKIMTAFRQEADRRYG
ncbi:MULTISPECIES: type II toxin-antitoxin system RatA family toxin [Henriciella]|uniref:Ubiquinone-binding protein n=1 Tax=Henriciella pelagia TaxID=1977912 RepID=A0ABQ1J3Y7_9PROT|nr:type II toxin-antitoxin system RatA family toxin [Henriciella pelagia]GGB59463.1 ubiquinone-binding protein [Henriciella pelagia]